MGMLDECIPMKILLHDSYKQLSANYIYKKNKSHIISLFIRKPGSAHAWFRDGCKKSVRIQMLYANH